MVLALMRRFVSIKKPHQLKVQFADLLIDECYCHCHCRIGLVITSCLSPNLYSCSFHRSQCGTSDRRKSNKEFVQVVHLLMKRLIVGKSERRYCLSWYFEQPVVFVLQLDVSDVLNKNFKREGDVGNAVRDTWIIQCKY